MAKKATDIRSNPVVSYLLGALEEFGKVTWPTNEQTLLLTGIVVVVSFLVALFIGLTDLGLSELYSFISS